MTDKHVLVSINYKLAEEEMIDVGTEWEEMWNTEIRMGMIEMSESVITVKAGNPNSMMNITVLPYFKQWTFI